MHNWCTQNIFRPLSWENALFDELWDLKVNECACLVPNCPDIIIGRFEFGRSSSPVKLLPNPLKVVVANSTWVQSTINCSARF